MRKTDSQEWILRTMRRILAETGPKAARRFLDSRGGVARHEQASRDSPATRWHNTWEVFLPIFIKLVTFLWLACKDFVTFYKESKCLP